MKTNCFESVFPKPKPIIAMAHLPALPGTPRYDKKLGINHIVESLQEDVNHLIDGRVDAVIYCNEDDRPYVFEAGIEQIATMSRVIAETKPDEIPFGVDFLWDPMATIAIAHATGASFVREVFTGVYESDMGLWSPRAGNFIRFKANIGGDDILMLCNIVPEFASPLGSRSAVERAQSAVTSSLADAILISGNMAGAEADKSVIGDIKNRVNVPVLVNTGVNIENVKDYLLLSDGAIVGTSLKRDGITWNPVDPMRVTLFMEKVDEIRKTI